MTLSDSPPRLEDDLYRLLLRRPPVDTDPAAHLVWVRLLARAVAELADLAPHGGTALCADERGMELLSAFGSEGAYEDAMADGRPLARALVEWLARDAPPALLDVLRTEIWLAIRREERADAAAWERALGVRRSGGRELLLVTHDSLESLQALVGWRETTLGRAGHLLWLLGISPVRPVLPLAERPGAIVFTGRGASTGAVFVALDRV